MNMQKLFAILFGLSIVIFPFAKAMEKEKIETIGEKIETKEKSDESMWDFDWKKTWNEGGPAERSLMLGIPTTFALAMSAVFPTTSKLIWNVLVKPTVAYLAYKSVLSPKEKDVSWGKEIKNDIKNIWNWTKNIFSDDVSEEKTGKSTDLEKKDTDPKSVEPTKKSETIITKK